MTTQQQDPMLRRLEHLADFIENHGIGVGDECDAPFLREVARQIKDQQAELKARAEILDTIQQACGEGWWYGAADWRRKLRNFAEDSEQHRMSKDGWTLDRHTGITLYAHGGFYTAYYDDAATVWEQVTDDLPMFHVQVQSDPPHRACIHPLHINAWLEHFAGIFLPVLILGRDQDGEDAA